MSAFAFAPFNETRTLQPILHPGVGPATSVLLSVALKKVRLALGVQRLKPQNLIYRG